MEQYNVESVYCDEVIIVDTSQNVKFWIIGSEEKVLYRLTNRSRSNPIDVVIPRQFPTGHRIDILGQRVTQGKFGKITISNGIKVDKSAFAFSAVEEVVWPDDCLTIPQMCFFKSYIRKLSNICNVETIKASAFEESYIRKLQWPKHCEKIPERCFAECSLEEINVQNVKEIQDKAFAYSGIKRMIWPASCTHIHSKCFFKSMLEEINNLDNVERIDKEAFFGTKLNSLDLSNTNISHLEECSLSGLPKGCNIFPPYYVNQDEFEEAIKVCYFR